QADGRRLTHRPGGKSACRLSASRGPIARPHCPGGGPFAPPLSRQISTDPPPPAALSSGVNPPAAGAPELRISRLFPRDRSHRHCEFSRRVTKKFSFRRHSATAPSVISP